MLTVCVWIRLVPSLASAISDTNYLKMEKLVSMRTSVRPLLACVRAVFASTLAEVSNVHVTKASPSLPMAPTVSTNDVATVIPRTVQ